MRRSIFARRRPEPPPLTPVQRQRLQGWILMLDVDLERAQQVLRLPPARWPVPPCAVPALVNEYTGEQILPPLEAPTAEEAEQEAAAPAPGTGLRGAYARRAAARRSAAQ